MRSIVVALLAIYPLVAAASTMITSIRGEMPPVPDASKVEFEAAFDHAFTQTKDQRQQWPVEVYCRWTNRSKVVQQILIKDHDGYHGTLSYPWGIAVRLTDEAGRCFTKSGGSPDGWYDCSYHMSQLSELMPGDVITLKPGESVVRCFAIEDVVFGLTYQQAMDVAPVRDGVIDMTKSAVPEFAFPSGRNRIEIRFFSVEARQPLILEVPTAGGHAPASGRDG